MTPNSTSRLFRRLHQKLFLIRRHYLTNRSANKYLLSRNQGPGSLLGKGRSNGVSAKKHAGEKGGCQRRERGGGARRHLIDSADPPSVNKTVIEIHST